MAKKKSKAASSVSVWDKAEEVPRAGLPDADKTLKKQKVFRRYIIASSALFPYTLLAAGVGFANMGTTGEPVAAVATADPESKAVAMAAVTDWLAREPSPVPGARLLTWDTYTVLPEAVVEPGQQAAVLPDLESHQLTIRAKTGALMTVELLVAIAEDGQTSAVGSPSLTSNAPVTDEALSSSTPWPGMATDSASEPVVRAVESWAAAFTGTDPVTLRQVVGDPDATRAYVPLWGPTSTKANISTSAWVMDRSGETPVRTSNMLVQVALELTWPDQGENEDLPRAMYDLLVVGADTAAPRVVAWGGPGTGPILDPYSNAIPGRDLTTQTTESGDESGAPAPEGE